MSLGRELSLHAGAALRSHDGGVARSGRKDEAVARRSAGSHAGKNESIEPRCRTDSV